MKKYLISALPFFLYACVVFVVFRTALFPPVGKMLFAPDILRYHYYFKPFLYQELKAGNIPLWNPYIMGGLPYLEHPQATPWYAPTLIFGFVPLDRAFALYFAFHIFIAMSAMFLFGRKWLGVVPSWTAGVIYSLSAYFVARIYAGHIDIIATSAWLPLVLGQFWRSMEKPTRKTIITAGVALAVQIFSGYQTIALFTLEAVVFAAAWHSLGSRSIKPFVTTILGIMIGLGISAVQILPNYQFVQRSIRTMSLPNAWEEIATPTRNNLLELLDPIYFYKYIPDDGLGHEHSLFFGKAALVLAIIGCLFLVQKKSKRWILWFFLLLGGGALWISFGHNAPVNLFALMRKGIPFYDQIRIPSRHIVLFITAMSVLAGFGLSGVKKLWIQIVIAAMVLFELVPFAKHNVTLGQTPEIYEDSALRTYLTSNRDVRLLHNFYHGNLIRGNLEFNAPMQYNIFSLSGYDSPPLRNYYEFLMAISNLNSDDIVHYVETIPPLKNINSVWVDFLSVGYIINPAGEDTIQNDLTGRFNLIRDEPGRGYRLYQNTQAMPRYQFVPNARAARDRDDVMTMLRSGSISPNKEVIIERSFMDAMYDSQGCLENAEGSVKIREYSLNAVQLEVTAPCDGYLVSSDLIYPGWEVFVDNKKTSLFEGNLAFRTVKIPKGTHAVLFRYVPSILFIGGIISVLTGIVCIGVWQREWN